MVVMEVHVAVCFHPALYGVPHDLSAIVEHLRDAVRVTLGGPLFLRRLSGELGGVLEDEHEPYIVDVREQLPDGWAALHRPHIQPAFRHDAKQVDQDGVVAVPGVEQSFEQVLVW